MAAGIAQERAQVADVLAVNDPAGELAVQVEAAAESAAAGFPGLPAWVTAGG